MITKDYIDFDSYELRFFLSCYMKDKKDREALRRGKYHSTETKAFAYRVLSMVQKGFKDLSNMEVYHELVIPFLQLAKRYKDKGKSFGSYLKAGYKYELMRHIDELLKSIGAEDQLFYFDQMHTSDENSGEVLIEEYKEGQIAIEMDEDLAFNNPNWINGLTTESPFDRLSRQERLIIAKYYYEGYTDKEIGRLIGRNPKSIHRVRARLKKKFETMIKEGEISWVKLKK